MQFTFLFFIPFPHCFHYFLIIVLHKFCFLFFAILVLRILCHIIGALRSPCHLSTFRLCRYESFHNELFSFCSVLQDDDLSDSLKLSSSPWAETVQVLYIGAGIAALGPIIAPVLRSMTSKLVSEEERGKVFSLLSVFDNSVPIISNVLYTEIYKATLQTMPGAFYWLTISTQLVVLLLILTLQFTTEPQPANEFIWNENENGQSSSDENSPDENEPI